MILYPVNHVGIGENVTMPIEISDSATKKTCLIFCKWNVLNVNSYYAYIQDIQDFSEEDFI